MEGAMDAYADTPGILVASALCDNDDDDEKFCNWLQGAKFNSAYAVPTILYGTGSDPSGFQEFSPGSVGKDYTTLTTDDIIAFITEQFGPPSGGPPPPSPAPTPPPTPTPTPPTPPAPPSPAPTPPAPTPPAPSPSPVPASCSEREQTKEGCEADGACEWCKEIFDTYMCTPAGYCNSAVV